MKKAWVWIAVISAIVAALTTVVVLMLRIKAKKRRQMEAEAIDYMISEECFDDELEEDLAEA